MKSTLTHAALIALQVTLLFSAAPRPAHAEEVATPVGPLKISAGAYLWHYQPFTDGSDNNTELYAAWLTLEKEFGYFGFHFESRFRDTPLRPFFTSNVWAQEVYGWYNSTAGKVKAGKVYSQFGRFWDGGFYGNLPYFDGLKLDTDVGVSFEGSRPLSGTASVAYAAQYFVVDGRTNGSLAGRDTLSVARQRNIINVRVAPTLTLGEELALTFGLSGQFFQADLAALGLEEQNVVRVNGEVEVKYADLTVFADVTRQFNGYAVPDYPVAGTPSADVLYLWAGVAYQWNKLGLRYNFSMVDYDQSDVVEMFHHPGLTLSLHDNLGIMAEYVYWQQTVGDLDAVTFDNSLNLILYGSL